MRGSWPFLPVTMHVMLLTCAQDIQTDHCWPAEGRVGGGMPARDRCTHGHGTWRLVELHPSRTPAGSLWVFHIKRIADGSIERDTARLIVQGFSHRPWWDYVESFAPSTRLSVVH